MDNIPIILVQGATGNAGFATVKALVRYCPNILIRAGVKDTAKSEKLQAVRGVQLVHLDVNYPQTVKEAMRGVSKLMICPPNTEDREAIVKLLIEAAVFAEVKHIVTISLPGAKEQKILFQRQFRPMELMLERSCIPYTVLRCPMFMDNFLMFASTIMSGRLEFPIGHGSTPLIDIRDVGECAAVVLANDNPAHKSRYYTLAGPQCLDGEDMADALSQGLGIEVKYYPASADERTAEGFQRLGFEQWQAKGFCELLRAVEAGEMKPSPKDTEMLLGRRPTTLIGWTREHAVFFQKSVAQQQQQQQQQSVTQQGERITTFRPDAQQSGKYAPHLPGHSQEWYDNYYAMHEEERSKRLKRNITAL